MEDRDRIAGLVGHKLAVRLTNVEAGSLEIIATLDEVRDDGIVLSEIGELGPGPTLFCPWDSLKFYELREAPAEGITPEPPVQRRRASARNLDRVVPIGQRQTVNEITVALASLELFELGVLRYRISYEAGTFCGIAEPELVVRDGSGRELPWSPQGGGGSESETDSEVELRDLPEAGELEVEVTRLVSLEFDEELGGEIEKDSYDGSWIFRFAI